MAILFEYGKSEDLNNHEALELLLQDIWRERLFVNTPVELTEENTDKTYQPFLQFNNKGIRANNYVGFIQNGEDLIEIFPKVFRAHFPNPDEGQKMLMLRHIFYWFSYCRKWKFPFNKASLDNLDINEFPELIIKIIATQFLETVSKQPLTMYHQVEEILQTPRGSINFKRYINNSLSTGNFQNIECDYEPFLFDNKVNQIIKYCSRLLMNQTKFFENQRILQEIVFILDEVEDSSFTSHDVDTVSLNTFFEDYSFLMDYCKIILNQQLYSSRSYDLSQWCLLFPMEYIFEDFLAGFLEHKFSKEWNVEYQKSEMNLSNTPPVFRMQHDIYLTLKKDPQKRIIIDAKYKLRSDNFKQDPKKGIDQNDLYQMVSYAFKRGCSDVILVYPNISETLNNHYSFEIISGFEKKEKVTVTAIEIPFWSSDEFNERKMDERMYEEIEKVLKTYQ